MYIIGNDTDSKTFPLTGTNAPKDN